MSVSPVLLCKVWFIFAVLSAYEIQANSNLFLRTLSRSSCRLNVCVKEGACFKKCRSRCCSSPSFGLPTIPCSNSSCEATCYEEGCNKPALEKCTATCTGSGSCYSRCSKCCKPDGKCRVPICPLACFPPNCGIKPTPTAARKCTTTCTGSGNCYSKCTRCCTPDGQCSVGICPAVCYPPGCGISQTPSSPRKCNSTCTGSGTCYTRCTKCCTPGGKCTVPICPKRCYPPGCGIKPTPPPKCTTTCTGSGSCYTRCTKCCSYDGKCGVPRCLKACLPPGCGASTPPPSPHSCEWKCVNNRGCRRWCRNCCAGGRCQDVHYSGCGANCSRIPKPQQPICSYECKHSPSCVGFRLIKCWKRCKCCCLNGICKRYPCLEKCYLEPNCGYRYR